MTSLSNNTLVLISGLPRHGKSTLAGMLSTFTGLPWADCSSVIYQELAKREDTTIKDLKLRDKNQLRASLIATGDDLCLSNPAYLADALIEQGIRIVSGVRKADEIEAILDKHSPTFEILHLWVEAFDNKEQAERFSLLNQIGDVAGGEDGVAADPSIYSAPTIHDNTDSTLRDLADFIVFNPTLSHLAETARFITARYV